MAYGYFKDTMDKSIKLCIINQCLPYKKNCYNWNYGVVSWDFDFAAHFFLIFKDHAQQGLTLFESKALQSSTRIYVVWDIYNKDSIKKTQEKNVAQGQRCNVSSSSSSSAILKILVSCSIRVSSCSIMAIVVLLIVVAK